MSLKVIVTRDFDHMSKVASDLVTERIATVSGERGAFNLGLATGNSPTGLYKWLAKAANGGAFDSSKVTTFNLDEYVGLPGENAQARAMHSESYSFFMVQELYGVLRTKFAQTNVPWGCLIDQDELIRALAANPGDWVEQGTDKGKAIVIRSDASSPLLRWVREQVLDAYQAKILAAGGIDLHVIGVGGRDHVAFHECGIPFEGNGMLLVKLDDNTVANALSDGHFESERDIPRYAISMGAELVYRARTVVLLANGARKAEPVAESLLEEVSEAVPISYGQRYAQNSGEMIYVIDEAAAAGVLARRTEIEARGAQIDDRRDQSTFQPVSALAFTRDAEAGALC